MFCRCCCLKENLNASRPSEHPPVRGENVKRFGWDHRLQIYKTSSWYFNEENASNQRQKKREAEEADKVEVAPGVTVASLRRFRTALIGPTQGLPKRRRLCR